MNDEPPVDVEVTSSTSFFDQVIEGVLERVLKQSNARMVYGEPTVQGDRSVIPVARISTGFGFGGGAGQGPTEEGGTGSGSGGGVGGKITAVPVGYIEISPEESKFEPITDSTAIALRTITFVGICAVLIVFGVMRSRRAD